MTDLSSLSISGFSVSTAGRMHIFKPVSVQAMWYVRWLSCIGKSMRLSVLLVNFNTPSPPHTHILQFV